VFIGAVSMTPGISIKQFTGVKDTGDLFIAVVVTNDLLLLMSLIPACLVLIFIDSIK
jgi:hypothetical protein